MTDTMALKVFLDLGGSGTKGVYWNPWEERFEVLWMEPHVALMNPEDIKTFKLGDKLGGRSPETSAYVQVDTQMYAVGMLGRILGGDSGLRNPKKDSLLVKVLAAIGVIWDRLRRNRYSNQFHLEIGFLLPLAEYWRHAATLEQELRAALVGFSYRGHSLAAKSSRIEGLPEGAGIYIARGRQLLQMGQNPAERVIVIGILGHRQASLLTFDHGNPPQRSNSKSDGPGFIRCLEQCVSAENADNPDLYEAFIKGDKHFRVQGSDELIDLDAKRSFAIRYYQDEVKKFFKRELSQKTRYELTVVGGAIRHSQVELQQNFFPSLELTERVNWAEEIQDEVMKYLWNEDGTPVTDETARIRLADVYGAGRWFALSKSVSQLSA